MTAVAQRAADAIAALDAKARRGEPIVMLTAYDVVSARVAEAARVDAVLVGDSGAMTVLGYASTRDVSLDEMVMLAGAVRRGAPASLVIGDMPFGTYEHDDAQAVASARRFVAAGCDAVKMEGAGPIVDRARAVIAAGIPVMGHVGLTPQATGGPEGFRVQGKTADAALALLHDGQSLARVGCFAIVLEAIPADVAELVAPRLGVPTIGIGAGAGTSGQVLVFHDLLGLYGGRTPRFVKRYANLEPQMVEAVARWRDDVRARRFPEEAHEYGMAAEELEQFRQRLGED